MLAANVWRQHAAVLHTKIDKFPVCKTVELQSHYVVRRLAVSYIESQVIDRNVLIIRMINATP